MTPSNHATAAAEAIRSLNHATLAGGYQWPSEVYDTVGELERAARMLPQALRQAATWLEREHDAGMIGHDRDENPGLAVQVVIGEMGAAIAAAASLSKALSGAQVACAPLTSRRAPCT